MNASQHPTKHFGALLTKWTVLAILTTGMLMPPSPVVAQSNPNARLAKAAAAGMVGTTSPQDEELSVPAGHSSLIRAPWRVKQVSIANDEIADVQMVAPEQVLLIGKKVGSTDLTLWSDDGQVWQTRVYVEVDLVQMTRDLKGFLPGSELKLTQTQDVVVVTGSLRRAEHAESLHRFLDATAVKYVDMTGVAGVQQVMIQVRVAEASRKAMRTLGINAFHADEGFFGGTTVNRNANGIDIGVAEGAVAGSNLPFTFNRATSVGSAVSLFAGFPDLDLQLFIEALAENQYLRVLAEPSLVAVTGQEASFLAGGEFPVPIVQGSAVGAGTSITIEYKEFGIRLRFRPTVLGDGSIRMHVAPEVSDLSESGAVVIDGFRIPSLLTRRAETTLEMKSGQTFAMAGLIDRSVTAKVDKVPGLGDLPILGPLFRSVRYERGDTELVIIATVSLVEPMNVADADALPAPGDTHIQPSDWELYAQARVEGMLPAKGIPAEARWIKQRGLHRLIGPGAWTTYGQRAPLVGAPASAVSPPADIDRPSEK